MRTPFLLAFSLSIPILFAMRTDAAIIYGPGTGDSVNFEDASGAAAGTVGAGGGRLFDRFNVSGFTTLQAPIDNLNATGAFTLATWTLNFVLDRSYDYSLDVELVAGADAGFATSLFQFSGPSISHDVEVIQNAPDYQLSETGTLAPGSYSAFFSSRSEVDGQDAQNNGATFSGTFVVSAQQAVPEPSTLVSFAMGLPCLAVATIYRRRRQTTSLGT